MKALYLLLIATSLALGAISASGRLAAQGVQPQRGVIELFTSQGCSACPPADLLLGKFARRDDVIALTFAVDLWDHLGWKDTLALPANSERQRAYARVRGDGQVYTPQVVVNGLAHVTGSNEADIEAALQSTRRQFARGRIKLEAESVADALVVTIGDAPVGMAEIKATVLVALVQRSAEVAIGRGENEGRRITYTNVVRALKPIGEWTGTAATVRLPKTQVEGIPMDFCIVLLQQGTAGPILASVEVR